MFANLKLPKRINFNDEFKGWDDQGLMTVRYIFDRG